MDIFEKCYAPGIADAYREKGIYPYFRALQTRQGPEVIMEHQRRIMLGSNNYLGLTSHPKVIEAAVKAVEQYGTGCSGSRFLNGTLDMHVELEERLAGFLHQEGAMTFSTGFQSNLGIISALVGRNDYVILDKEDHASIYDACRLSYGKLLRYEHNDMEALERCLQRVPESAGALIVTDGLFSMSGDIANLPEIVRLAKTYGARVMVDDAHGLGTLGKGGRGTPSHFGLEQEVNVYMGTFSKSLASLGGYMAGKSRIVDYVRHNSRPFIFSASVPPASCAAALAALNVLEEEPELPERLLRLSDFFREALKQRGMSIRESRTPIVPIFTYTADRTLRIAMELYKQGLFVNTVLPPAAPADGCMLRTSLMATLTESLLEEAADILSRVLSMPEYAMK